MAPKLLIEAVGPAATVQDAGRFGQLRFGVTPAGPMDPIAFAAAARALGNAPGAAAVEIGLGGIVVAADAPLALAFAGGAFRWTRGDQPLPSAARIMLRPGETLRARAGASGSWCYLAVAGGFDTPLVMGSRATHTRSRLGGLEGQPLAAGDRLPVAGPSPVLDDVEIGGAWRRVGTDDLRVVLGPQDDHFTKEAVATFLDADWTVSGTIDRMAYALEGPVLAHARDFNIVSDGVALGAIQVAGDGRPLVLMADRQPTGGYPKIAHVVRADIGHLAQRRPGETCRFAAIDVAQARAALARLDAALAGVPRDLVPLRRAPAAEHLAQSNLIGGVTDGTD